MHFDATTSTDPDGDPLTYSWDLDGNGTYGDSTAAKPSRTYATGTYEVGLRVDDGHGHISTATQQIQSGNTPPVLGTVTPDASLTWSVGQTIGFSATATDAQDGTLPASAYSWNVAIRHCPSGVCHTHNLTTFSGPTGSFPAPDHEYPSHLLLTLTVTDSGGLATTRTVELDPKTVELSFASAPTGATITVNGADHGTPYSETFIRGSRVTITAAPTLRAAPFASWSDGGARSHELSAAATATYTARYATGAPNTAPTRFALSSSPRKVKVKVDGERQRPPYRTWFDAGTVVRLVAPKVVVRHGLHYAFKKWRGVQGNASRNRKIRLTVGFDPVAVTAVFRRAQA